MQLGWRRLHEKPTIESRGFLEAGFTPAQALEVVIGVSQGTLASLVSHLAETPLDAGFQPQQWTVPV